MNPNGYTYAKAIAAAITSLLLIFIPDIDHDQLKEVITGALGLIAVYALPK